MVKWKKRETGGGAKADRVAKGGIYRDGCVVVMSRSCAEDKNASDYGYPARRWVPLGFMSCRFFAPPSIYYDAIHNHGVFSLPWK